MISQQPSRQQAMQVITARGFAYGRLIFWLALGIWAYASYFLATPIADNMRERINDLSVVPGAGLVMRDPEGIFYHVNNEGQSRAIFPDLAPPVYQQACLDCTLVTGEQLSQTNDFCITGIPKNLPQLDFEIPCHTWAPQGTGRRVITFGLFMAPLLLFWGLRALLQKQQPRPIH